MHARTASYRNIRILTWINFLQFFRLYAPILVIYFERETGSYVAAMSLLSVVMLSSAIFEVPTGVFSDMVGRRWTTICGTVSSLIFLIFYGIGGSYPVLFAGAIFNGLERAFFSGNNDALLYDSLAENGEAHEYATYLGRVTSSVQFSLAISAVLGGLVAAISFDLALWVSVIPLIAMVGISFLLVEPSIHVKRSGNIYVHLREALKNVINNPRLRLFNIGHIIGYGIGEAAFAFRTVFIELLWPIWAIGVARFIANICATVSFYYAGALLKRFGERRLMLGGMLTAKVVVLFAVAIPSVLSPALMGATSLVFGVNTVALSSLLQREFTNEQRSTMGSLTALGDSIMFAIMAVIFGWLADLFGIQTALTIAAILAFLPLYFYWMAFRERSRQNTIMSAGK